MILAHLAWQDGGEIFNKPFHNCCLIAANDWVRGSACFLSSSVEKMPETRAPVLWLYRSYRVVGKDGFEGFVLFATAAAHS